MTKTKAKEVLIENPQADVRFREVNHVDFKSSGEEFRVWLEEEELVFRHPTQPGSVASAPEGARYYIV